MKSKRLTKVIATLLVVFSLSAAFVFGYFLGGRQAKKGFPEETEMWQKETGPRLSKGLSPCTVWFPDGTYHMYYVVAEGIVSAASYNGLGWMREDGLRIAPDLNDKMQAKVGGPAVFELKKGRYRMIYEGTDEEQTKRYFFSAVSEDGVAWTKEKGIRLKDQNEFGQDFVSAPEIVRLPNSKLRMYYSNGSQIRCAISSNEGKTWKKESISGIDEPVIDIDIIIRDDGIFKMYYTVSSSSEELKNLKIVSATSEDGLKWTKDKGVRIKTDKGAKMVFDPDVVKVSRGKYRMYYCQLDSGSFERKRSYEEEPPAISIQSAVLELR